MNVGCRPANTSRSSAEPSTETTVPSFLGSGLIGNAWRRPPRAASFCSVLRSHKRSVEHETEVKWSCNRLVATVLLDGGYGSVTLKRLRRPRGQSRTARNRGCSRSGLESLIVGIPPRNATPRFPFLAAGLTSGAWMRTGRPRGTALRPT